QLAQFFGNDQHQIGGQHAVVQCAGQLNTHHFGQRNGNGQPHHDGFGLDAAYPPAQNTQAVDHGCVAVSTHTGIRVGQIGAVVISRPDHAPDVFKVQLVHDALARRHHPDAVEAAATPAQKGKALGVALI